MGNELYDAWRQYYLEQLAADGVPETTPLYDLRRMWLANQLDSNVIPVTAGQSIQAAIDAAIGDDYILCGTSIRSANAPDGPSVGTAIRITCHDEGHEVTDEVIVEWCAGGVPTISSPIAVGLSAESATWHTELRDILNVVFRDAGNSTVAPAMPQQWFNYPEYEVCIYAVSDHHLHVEGYPGYTMPTCRTIDIARDSTDWIDILVMPGTYEENVLVPNHVRVSGSPGAIIAGSVYVTDQCVVDSLTIDATTSSVYQSVHITPIGRDTSDVTVSNCRLMCDKYGIGGPMVNVSDVLDGYVPGSLARAVISNNRINASQPFWLQSVLVDCKIVHNICEYNGDASQCFGLFDAPAYPIVHGNEWAYNTFTGRNSASAPYGFVLTGYGNTVHHNHIDLCHPGAVEVVAIRYQHDLTYGDADLTPNVVSNNIIRLSHEGEAVSGHSAQFVGVHYSNQVAEAHAPLILEQNTFLADAAMYRGSAAQIAITGSAESGTEVIVRGGGLGALDAGACGASNVTRRSPAGMPFDLSKIVWHVAETVTVLPDHYGCVIVNDRWLGGADSPQISLPAASAALLGTRIWYLCPPCACKPGVYSEDGQLRLGGDSDASLIAFADTLTTYALLMIECTDLDEWTVTEVNTDGLLEIVF